MFRIQTNIPDWLNMKVIHCPFYGLYTSIQKKQLMILQWNSWHHKMTIEWLQWQSLWPVTESHDIIKKPSTGLNHKLNDQLLNCMTTYIDHCSTTSKKTNEKKIVGANPSSWWNPHQGIQLVQRLFSLSWPSTTSWDSQGHQRAGAKSATK